MSYDAAGRVLSVSKKINNSPEVIIAKHQYDEPGQLKKKEIGQVRNTTSLNTYTSNPIDSLWYSYNIRGWLRGINKDYARNDPSGSSSWFGMELCYDFGFGTTQLNGNIAGMRWLVYPQPISSPLPAPSSATTSGERSGDGGQEDFAGFRERQPADSPRHVAWKASARDAGERPLLVKQFAGGAQVEMQLDWALTDPAQALESRLSLLAGWVLAAEAAGCSYGLRLPGQEILPNAGDAHQRRCLEALALFQA